MHRHRSSGSEDTPTKKDVESIDNLKLTVQERDDLLTGEFLMDHTL